MTRISGEIFIALFFSMALIISCAKSNTYEPSSSNSITTYSTNVVYQTNIFTNSFVSNSFFSISGYPTDIVLIADQHLWIGQAQSSDIIKRYTLAGVETSNRSANSSMNSLKFIAIDPSLQFYTTISVMPEAHYFRRFNSQINTNVGSNGSGNGEFHTLGGICADLTSNIFICDKGNRRIQRFDTNLNFISAWGNAGTNAGQIDSPIDIASDNTSQFVYIIDNKRIQKFNYQGSYVTSWGSHGSNAGEFINPSCITVNSLGYVYIFDTSGRVSQFSSNGSFVGHFVHKSPYVYSYSCGIGFCADSNNNIYIGQAGSTYMGPYYIIKYSPGLRISTNISSKTNITKD